jgi:hypothetical protein
MDPDSQIVIPDSFIALQALDRRGRPLASREAIAARYEFCEDLAQQLGESARTVHIAHGIAEDVVLQRCHQGLLDAASGTNADEATWVIRRLAELLGWDDPGPSGPDTSRV